jgi:hypothetical protein
MGTIFKKLLRNRTLAQQAHAIKARYPDWEVQFDAVDLVATGKLRPTSRSEEYTVEISLGIRKGRTIQVRILNPRLVPNNSGEKIPHMYSQTSLCLYMPKYSEFKRTDYVSETILPWTSLWLYYYELWHATGEWLGGGEHPN